VSNQNPFLFRRKNIQVDVELTQRMREVLGAAREWDRRAGHLYGTKVASEDSPLEGICEYRVAGAGAEALYADLGRLLDGAMRRTEEG
jgi:hypothetical protein